MIGMRVDGVICSVAMRPRKSASGGLLRVGASPSLCVLISVPARSVQQCRVQRRVWREPSDERGAARAVTAEQWSAPAVTAADLPSQTIGADGLS
jgi:hypothetical protein